MWFVVVELDLDGHGGDVHLVVCGRGAARRIVSKASAEAGVVRERDVDEEDACIR